MKSRSLWIILILSNAVWAAPQGITIEEQKLTVQTKTLTAVFDGPRLVSLRPVEQSIDFAHPVPAQLGVDVQFLNGDFVGVDKHQTTAVRKLSELAALIEIKGDETRRSLLLVIDPDNGDLRVTPDGLTDRRALRTVRWTVPFHPEATLFLPVVNGLQVNPNESHPGTALWAWPVEWNAQLAIARLGEWSMMIHGEDTYGQFKCLYMRRTKDRTELGFESVPPGPLWDNRTAGGIEWRVNVYRGDWQVPATRYRQWMEKAYDLPAQRAHRPAWVDKISLAVCWAAPNEPMLDALAAAHPPEQTLIHLSDWRTDKYDINYPEYTPREQTLAFMAKARQMGFHVMPHFNYLALYYQHPLYQEMRDFQFRSLDQNKPQGWLWPPDTYAYTRMAYMHAGLGYWRQTLLSRVVEACERVGTDVAFLDQTLCTHNTDNGLVQGLTTVQGLRQLQEEFAAVVPGLVLVGEGLNEVSFQRQSFAQAHIYHGHGKLNPKHVEVAHPLNAFLWGRHTRLIGYHHLRPNVDEYDLGVEVYERMNALPTIVTNNPKDLQEMTPLTKRIFDRAKSLATRPAETP